MDKLQVLFIAGAGRSGSTILHNILGQLEGYCAVGEIRYIWERALIKNRLCGCGVPWHECRFWQAVMEEEFGSIEAVDAGALFKATESFRTSHLPLTLLPGQAKSRIAALADYRHTLERLYRAIQRVSGCRVIVDLSKNPAYAYLLSTLPALDLSVVHCLRDPRAVAHSWGKPYMRFQPGDDNPDPIPPRPPLRSSLHWLSWNVAADLFVKPRLSRVMTLKYESFVREPRETIAQIVEMTGGAADALPFADERTAMLERPNHSIFGNPVRFRRGLVPIKLDDAWRDRLSAWAKARVTAYTAPALLPYGYSLWP
jgi:hypothetical protein